MAYKTKGGKILTDDIIEKMGLACENGEYPGVAKRTVVAPVGRPQICPNEDLITVAFKVPRSFKDKLDETAKKKNTTRSEYLREILGKVLEM
jgi:hypothetical protein